MNPGSVDASRKRARKLAEFAIFDSDALTVDSAHPYDDGRPRKRPRRGSVSTVAGPALRRAAPHRPEDAPFRAQGCRTLHMQTNTRIAKWERASAPLEDWRNLILDSRHEDEVVELVRDHMARWTPGRDRAPARGLPPADAPRRRGHRPVGVRARLDALRRHCRGRGRAPARTHARVRHAGRRAPLGAEGDPDRAGVGPRLQINKALACMLFTSVGMAPRAVSDA